MKLSREEVEHVARLARVRLTEEEKNLFSEQLSGILEYVEQLQEVDTDGIEETSQVTGIVNSLRDDTVHECQKEIRDDIIRNVPELEDDHIKTKSVFES